MSTINYRNIHGSGAPGVGGIWPTFFNKIMSQALVQTNKDKDVEYIPFGTQSKIKLSLSIIKNFVAVPGKNGELPDDRQSMRFMMLCRSRQLDPFQGDAFMIPFWNSQKNGYEWSMVTAQQAFLKRAEIHPDFNGKQSGIIINQQSCAPCQGSGRIEDKTCERCDGKGWWDELEGDFLPESLNDEPVKLLGGWCKVYYKGKDKPEYQRLRLSTYMKNTSQWKDDPCGMICKCAEAAALRSAFPNTVGGLFLREETEAQSFARPEFNEAPTVTVETSPQPKAEVTPTTTTEPKAQRSNIGQVADLRKRMKGTGVTEAMLISYLTGINAIPDGMGTLEEVVLNAPEVMEMLLTDTAKVFDAALGEKVK